MNIVFSNSIGKHKFGGGEKWMLLAAKGLMDVGHKVFLAGKKNSELLKAALKMGIRTYIVNIRADFSPINTYRIVKFLKKHNIHVLVCNLNKDLRVAGLAAKLVKTPVVIARHGVLLKGKKWSHRETLTRFANGILTNTESIKRTYLNYGWFDSDFVKVIYNGISDKSSVVPYDFKQQYPDKKIIFSAGRLSEQKGFSYLIKAASLLSRHRNDLIFVIAGKGRLESQLKNQVRESGMDDCFRFIGYKENMDPYLKGCDLFVLTSLYEGMPNVVMEAMAVGKAVIATDVNGVRELMEDGKTGIIIPPQNPELLAASIEQTIDDPLLLAEYGKNGLQRVKNNFTYSQMIKNLERYFQEKLDGKSKTG